MADCNCPWCSISGHYVKHCKDELGLGSEVKEITLDKKLHSEGMLKEYKMAKLKTEVVMLNKETK